MIAMAARRRSMGKLPEEIENRMRASLVRGREHASRVTQVSRLAYSRHRGMAEMWPGQAVFSVKGCEDSCKRVMCPVLHGTRPHQRSHGAPLAQLAEQLTLNQ